MKKILLGLLLCLNAQAQTAIAPFYGQQVYRQTMRTYSASQAAITPFATPNDLCSLPGNATTTVRLTRVTISATQTTAGVNSFFLTKRSTLDGGTPTAMTIVKHDTNYPSALSTPVAWPSPGVSPSPQPSPLGSTEGNLLVFHLVTPAPAGTTGGAIPISYDLDLSSNPVILHSTEEVSVNFNGAALPAGLSLHCNFEWTEY